MSLAELMHLRKPVPVATNIIHVYGIAFKGREEDYFVHEAFQQGWEYVF